MIHRYRACVQMVLTLALVSAEGHAATQEKRYYAHDAVVDRYGVIAPWYRRSNGQIDFRINIAAQTLKRYPWLDASRCSLELPEYLLSSFWKITPAGQISTMPLTPWMNGDRGQLAAYVLRLMPIYYRYSGDPVALAHARMEADAFLQFAQTDDRHPWPRFPISVPVKGKPYGPCDPNGFMQLDLAARAGSALLSVYELTGEPRYLEAVKHWGDVLAEKVRFTPQTAPWDRYANFEQIDVAWKDNRQTGGVVAILALLDELIRLGYTGANDRLVKARDAGRTYLLHTLLPAWAASDTWGRQYWDWPCPVQVPNVTAWAAMYMMDHPETFPNWRTDVRNMLGLCLNHTCVSPASMGEVYNGAWATPESSGCCGLCLLAGPQLMCEAWARYGVEADSAWAREIARRQIILATYDCLESGRAEDNIHGGMITNEHWFEAAHLSPMETCLNVMQWLPEVFAPPRENHIVRSSSVVCNVAYGKDRINYTTFDATAPAVDVLRLSFAPTSVRADDKALALTRETGEHGYIIRRLSGGDCIIVIRHDGARRVRIEGADPQTVADDAQLYYEGEWTAQRGAADSGGVVHVSNHAGSAVRLRFTGNSVRLLGRTGASGGRADVFIDRVQDRAGIDCWCPQERAQQTLFSRNGLTHGEHELRVVVSGKGNPRSRGADVCIEDAITSSATAEPFSGEGGGPTDAQRMIFGYAQRADYRDSAGHAWRPGCEFIVRSGHLVDSVQAAWWTQPVRAPIAGTADPDLYAYGIHAPDLRINVTVGPGSYRVRLKFAAAAERKLDTHAHPMDVWINQKRVAEHLDVMAAAGGADRAVDLDFEKITPLYGIIEVRLEGVASQVDGGRVQGEAFVQALEIEPQPD